MSWLTELLKTGTKKTLTTAAESGSPGMFTLKWLDEILPKKPLITAGEPVKIELLPNEFLSKYGLIMAGGINIFWYGLGALIILNELYGEQRLYPKIRRRKK